jgi:hypothetical protein
MQDSYIHFSIKRSVAMWSLIAALAVPGIFYYQYSYGNIPSPPAEDIVKVKSNGIPINVPEEFRETLASMGVTGLALVDQGKVLQAITPEGVPINLCGSGSNPDVGVAECSLDTTPNALVNLISTASNCGTCLVSGIAMDCNKNTNTWRCLYNPGNPCGLPCQ